MNTVEFRSFQKIPRLFRDVVVTEKIDGTNAAVRIVPLEEVAHWPKTEHSPTILFDPEAWNSVAVLDDYVVFAQSRNRLITPEYDNHGFAQWVKDNAIPLVETLGKGIHFGEWWGNGIQRGYGLSNGDKRFSLFNTTRWVGVAFPNIGLSQVPILWEGHFNLEEIEFALADLADWGSHAAPGYMNPEGVVVYHTAGNSRFKVTLKNDEKPKSCVA